MVTTRTTTEPKKQKPTQKEKKAKEVAKAMRDQTLMDITSKIHEASKSSPNGKPPYRFVQNLVDGMRDVCPWATRSIIDKAYKKRVERQDFSSEEESAEQSNENAESEQTKKIRNKGGRPKGTTLENQMHLETCIIAANNEIAAEYKKKLESKTGGRIPKGWLSKKNRRNKTKENYTG